MAFGRMSNQQGAATPINSINVTPLVDVMLVLVVIFILAAPMLAASLRVQLPKAQAAAPQTTVAKGDALMVEVNPRGEIWIQGAAVDDAAVQQQLKDLGQRNPQAEVQLRADTSVPYGRVVQVMGEAQKAGLNRIGFVADPAGAAPPVPAASQ